MTAAILRPGQALSLLLALVPAPCFAGAPGTPQATASQDLTPEQQATFKTAQADFAGQHWAAAADKLQALHTALPANILIAKFDGEAQTNAGHPAEATALLAPILAAHPDDVQALAILAHAQAAQAQWSSLQTTLHSMQILHDTGKTQLNQVLLGEDPLPDNGRIQWLYYLQPSWNRYNVYSMARVLTPEGAVHERISLESGDGDQRLFATEHPDLAAKGMRSFSIDAYVNTDERTQTHFTYIFLNGQPTWETFREKALAIASGKLTPLSSRSGIPVPSSPR